MKGLTENIVNSLQDVGTAVWFGGLTFGSLALSPAVKVIDDRKERGELMKTVWRNYSPASWIGLGALAGTTIYWSMQNEQRLTDQELLIARIRTGLVLGAIASTAASAILGNYIAKQTPDERTPIESGSKPAQDAPPAARKAQKAYPFLSTANIACGLGVIVCSSLLSHRKRSNTGWLW